jgi:bifunctional non-homologous end joining protein LigD
VILDGEIVALGKDGVPSFERLQRRWPQNRRPSTRLLRQVPTSFYAFDVIGLDGKDITHRSYAERREALEGLAAESRCRIVKFPCNWTDTDPAIVLEVSAELNLEGIVCKGLDSPYKSGVRSPHWIKTPLRRRSEFRDRRLAAGRGAESRHSRRSTAGGALP